MIHILKTDPPFFHSVWKGTKTFEVRKNDRNFQVGDGLCLKEHDRRVTPARYTGRVIDARIVYMTHFAQQEGMVALGIEVTGRHTLAGPWVTSTGTLAGALRELALQVDSLDGVPNTTMLEAAQRLEELQVTLDHTETLLAQSQEAIRTFHGRAQHRIIQWFGDWAGGELDNEAIHQLLGVVLVDPKCPVCGIPWSEAERAEMVNRKKAACLCGFTREIPKRIHEDPEGGE